MNGDYERGGGRRGGEAAVVNSLLGIAMGITWNAGGAAGGRPAGRPATATVDRAGRDRTTYDGGKLVADGGNDDGIKDMDTLTRSRGKEGGREGQSQRGK